MLRHHIWSIVFWGNFIGAITVTVNYAETNDANRPSYPDPCLNVTSRTIGSLHLSQVPSRNRTCLWRVQVEAADSISVAIGYKMASTIPFTIHSPPFRILFYNQPPNEGIYPLMDWLTGDDSRVFKILGSQLWIISVYQDKELLGTAPGLQITLSYVANISGTAMTCAQSDVIFMDNMQKNVDHIQSIAGHIQPIAGHIFGSYAELVCDKGFVLENGNGRVQCLVVNDVLTWVSGGSICVTICKHPRETPNAKVSLKIDVQQGLDNDKMMHIDKNMYRFDDAQIRSLAEYSCDEPYFLKGESMIHCGPDEHGTPTWFGPLPVCFLPDCSEPYTLTRVTGTIVSQPFPPGTHLKGGSVACTWEIVAPIGWYISLTVDLPDDMGVTLRVFDADRPRPVQLLHLKTQSEVLNVDSETSRVLVTYHGPPYDVTNHKRFYLSYVMKSRQLRIKRNDDLDEIPADDDLEFHVDDSNNVSTNPADASVGVQPGTSVSTNDTPTDASKPGDVTVISPVSTLPTTDGLPIDAVSTNPSQIIPASLTQQFDTSYAQTVSTSSNPKTNDPSSSPTQSIVYTGNTDTPVEMTTDEIVNGEITQELITDETENGEITPKQITNSIDNGEITHYPITASSTQQSPFSSLAKNLSVPIQDDSNDDWKIAVGVVIPLLILSVAVSVGYYCYRKRYPVRMIIGREFGKFSNPTYSRSKQVISLVRDDADDYFANRSTSTLTLDEMNPVNRNINYDNPAFVADERDGHDNDEEEERRFREKKAWLFKKDSEVAENIPLKESEGKTRSHSSEIEIQGAESECFKDGDNKEMQMTPRALSRTRKLARARSISILTDTSLELQVSEPETSSESSEEVREPLNYNAPAKKTSNPNVEAKDEGESNYMKVAKMIFEQPSYEEVCAEFKARSRSMSLDRAPPESRMRSYSVGILKSARRHSLRGEVIQLEHWRTIANETNLPADTIAAVVVDVEKLGQSGKSISSIISETSIIDVSVLEGLPFEARERCLSMDSLNSNPHLVTDLDDVSTGSSTHEAEENAKDVATAADRGKIFRLKSNSSSSNDSLNPTENDNERVKKYNPVEKVFPLNNDRDLYGDNSFSDPVVTNAPVSGDSLGTDSDIISPLPKSEEFESDIFFFPNAGISIDESREAIYEVEDTRISSKDSHLSLSKLKLSGVPEKDDHDTPENKITMLKVGSASDFEKYKNELEGNSSKEESESSTSSHSSGSETSKSSRSASSSDGEEDLHTYSFTQIDHERSQIGDDVGVERVSLDSETDNLPPPLPVTPPPIELLHVTGVITARPVTFSPDEDSNYFQFPPRDTRSGSSSRIFGDQIIHYSSDTSDVNPPNEIIGSSILRQTEGDSSDNIIRKHVFERSGERENEAREKITVEDIAKISDNGEDEDNASRQLRIRSSFSGPVNSDLGNIGTFVLTAEEGANEDIDV